MKPYTVSGNLIYADFSTADETVEFPVFVPSHSGAKLIDAYDQLNDSGELLYISPPCEVEPNGCA